MPWSRTRKASCTCSRISAVSAVAAPAVGAPPGAAARSTSTCGPGADVIVYVVGFKEEGDPKAEPAKIAQKDRKFVPDLVAITVGETVSFPNGDAFMHNVFSQSAARRFDLGSFKKGDAKTKDFP